MSAVDDAKTVMQLLAGKALDNDQMLSIATNYVYSFGAPANPYDPATQEAEYNAFPTPVELADLFLKRMRNAARDRIKDYAEDKATRDAQSAIQAARESIKTAVQDAVNEL